MGTSWIIVPPIFLTDFIMFLSPSCLPFNIGLVHPSDQVGRSPSRRLHRRNPSDEGLHQDLAKGPTEGRFPYQLGESSQSCSEGFESVPTSDLVRRRNLGSVFPTVDCHLPVPGDRKIGTRRPPYYGVLVPALGRGQSLDVLVGSPHQR